MKGGSDMMESTSCSGVGQDLLLYHYEDLPAGRNDSIHDHLAGCARCRAELASYRETLGAVDQAGLDEIVAASMPSDWTDHWKALKTRLEAESFQPARRSFMMPMLKAAAVILVAGASFMAGRQWDSISSLGSYGPLSIPGARGSAESEQITAPANAEARLRLFSEHTHGYLNRSRLVLLEFANTHVGGGSRTLAAASTNLLRETTSARKVAGQLQDQRIEELLGQVESLLKEIARLSEPEDPTTINRIKTEMNDSGVLDQLELMSFVPARIAQERS
jgi:hypothetical protein